MLPHFVNETHRLRYPSAGPGPIEDGGQAVRWGAGEKGLLQLRQGGPKTRVSWSKGRPGWPRRPGARRLQTDAEPGRPDCPVAEGDGFAGREVVVEDRKSVV